MNFPLSPEIIAAVSGPYGPIQNVRANWPLVEAALDRRGVYSPFGAVAAIATIAVETGTFYPGKERGGPTYMASAYDNRTDLGNTNPGDGSKFRGRGFIQINGQRDYERFGMEIGVDLVKNPDLALDPQVAAELLAVIFKERDITRYADEENWEIVRRRINGGLTGWPRFIDAATTLVTALRNPPAPAGVDDAGRGGEHA